MGQDSSLLEPQQRLLLTAATIDAQQSGFLLHLLMELPQ